MKKKVPIREQAEFADLQKTAEVMPKTIFWIFLGVGLLSTLIAVITGISAGSTMAREQSAPGVVVEMVARKESSGNDYFYPLVEFRLPDGSEKRVQTSEGSWPPSYYPGEAVTVLYDPERPLNARIQSFGGTIGLWIATLITGVLGVIFTAVSFIVRKVLG